MTLFTLPTARRITQSWNMDFKVLNGKFYPNGFYASIGWLGHNGIDYGCPLNDDIEAVCDGIIEYVGPANGHPLLTGGGNAVLLRNDDLGIRFEYLHLNQQNVYTGQRVKRGQVIAQSGNTGISSGPHLHLGAIPLRPNLSNGYRGRVDPTPWLYGPSNPDYAGALTVQGTLTPQPSQEDDMSVEGEKELLGNLQKVVPEVVGLKEFVGGMNEKLDALIQAAGVEKVFDEGVNEKVDELVGNLRKTFWNTEESRIILAETPAPELAAQIDAAGSAAAVLAELVRLLEGK